MNDIVNIGSNILSKERFDQAYDIFYAGVDILGYPEDYSEINLLGRGSYGVVYQFKRINNLGSIVVKVISKAKTDIEFLQEEISVLKKLRKSCAKYVLCYLGAFEDSKNYYILTEYLGNYVTLFDFRNLPGLSNTDKRTIIENLVLGLRLIHSHGIAHRDIKPENIMINPETLDIKYIDFGGACDVDPCIGSMHTSLYMAPEILGPRANRPRTLKQWMRADLWSLGETIWEIIIGDARQIVWEGSFLRYQEGLQRNSPKYWNLGERYVYDLLTKRGVQVLDRKTYIENFIYDDPLVPSPEGKYKNPYFIRQGEIYSFDLEGLFSLLPNDRVYLKRVN